MKKVVIVGSVKLQNDIVLNSNIKNVLLPRKRTFKFHI